MPVKNILHVITTLESEGAQILLLNTVQYLDRHKHNIFVAYIYKKATALTNFPLPNHLKVIDLSNKGKFSCLVLFKLLWLIKKEKIDLVHTHLVHAGIIGKIAAKMAGVKDIIMTRHYAFSNKQSHFLYRLEDKLTQMCSKVIAISKAVEQHLVDNKIVPQDKIIVVHNGVSLDNFKLYKKNNISDKKNKQLLIGSIGRLHPAKGFPDLLRCFKVVRDQLKNVRLEIVGEGELREELQSLAANLKVSKNVCFVGSISHAEIPRRLNTWDLFVMPSLWEGFGLAIIEAMAMGKAVVATKVDGIIEIVDDGKTGFLVPINDTNMMASKIIALLKDEKKRIQMGKKGREKVVEQFLLENTANKIENIYDSFC